MDDPVSAVIDAFDQANLVALGDRHWSREDAQFRLRFDGKPIFVDGKPVFIPVFEPGVTLGEVADACLYFGSAEPRFVEPDQALYAGTEYGKEVQRRRRVLMPSRRTAG